MGHLPDKSAAGCLRAASATSGMEQGRSPGPGRVAFCCVAENKVPYLLGAYRLLQSLRWFGGSLAEASFYVCAVEAIDPDYAREFEKLGAFVRVVPRVSTEHGHSNKLSIIDLEDIYAYDTVLLLDCDTVIVQDPLPHIDGQALQGKMAFSPTVTHEEFAQLFAHFGLPLPRQEYRCNPRDIPTIWYCNSGVLVFSRSVLTKFGPVWKRYNQELLAVRHQLLKRPVFCDQASLALAYAAEPVPFRELPLAMNFQFDLGYPYPEDQDPVILHYHRCLDVYGCLVAPMQHAKAQQRVAQFNHRQHQERQKEFNNRFFWDYRYHYAPERGSGKGSRGEAAVYKQELLRQQVHHYRPGSILDVGCGDQEVGRRLPDERYTGVDISRAVIERNRQEFPGRKYLCGDILQLDLASADMVLCLDVLIHIDQFDTYHAMVRRLVEKTAKVGLVSGFETCPANRPITFFHEPLSETLRRAGAQNLRQVGAYKNVVLWSFEPPTAAAASVSPAGTALDQPVFLVGCMRSGTTLLAGLLGHFPGIIHCPFELKHVWSQAGPVPMASPRTRDRHCPPLGAADVCEGQRERLTQAFRQEMEGRRQGKTPDACFLSKNPHLCNKLPFVRALFPQARFLWIHRQLPAVVASLKNLFLLASVNSKTWHYWPEPRADGGTRCWEAFHYEPPPKDVDPRRCFPGGDVGYLAEYWLENNLACSSFMAQLPPDAGLSLREEDLIGQPEVELARCLAFLGLPLLLPVGLLDDLDASRNQLWASRLTPEEIIALLEFIDARGPDLEQLCPGARTTYFQMILNGLRAAIRPAPAKEIQPGRSLWRWLRHHRGLLAARK